MTRFLKMYILLWSDRDGIFIGDNFLYHVLISFNYIYNIYLYIFVAKCGNSQQQRHVVTN
jgi:hypothetical protein